MMSYYWPQRSIYLQPWPGPHKLLWRGAFHGRTMGALSATSSRAGFREKYAPFLPSVFHVSYPYCFRCPYEKREDTCSLQCLAEVENLFQTIIPPGDIASIIFEPLQGEGGYIVPPVKYVHSLRELASKYNILLIFDEIQTGFGRTGTMFAAEYFNVTPDIMCLGKAMAGGFPLSAVISTKNIMGDWTPGAHGSTFGANPVSCAVALSVLEVMKEDNILDNCREMGTYFKSELIKLKKEFPVIGDVRGLGLMLAVELVDDKGRPDSNATNKITSYCLEHKLLFFNCGVYKNCIRFITPLNIDISIIEEGLQIFRNALKSLG